MVRSPTGSAALARTRDRGRRRVARPAVSTSAGIMRHAARHARAVGERSFLAEHHVRACQPELFAMLDEEAAIRVEHEIGLCPPERLSDRENPALAAFDLDECTNG